MGFRNDAYATVWEVTSKTPNVTQLRISTSHKNKETGAYETDFSGFVACVGSKVAAEALHLHEKDRIKLITHICGCHCSKNNMLGISFNLHF